MRAALARWLREMADLVEPQFAVRVPLRIDPYTTTSNTTGASSYTFTTDTLGGSSR